MPASVQNVSAHDESSEQRPRRAIGSRVRHLLPRDTPRSGGGASRQIHHPREAPNRRGAGGPLAGKCAGLDDDMLSIGVYASLQCSRIQNEYSEA